MSLDATIWAWRAEIQNSSQRLVLLTLADRAGENHKCFPSLKRMEKDTKLNRKTIIKVLDELEASSFIKFTGETTGNGVKIYQLIGVLGREEDSLTNTKNGTSTENGTSSNSGTGSKSGTSTNNGTTSSTENGTATSTNIGTQNLPVNLPIESINKNPWLDFKKLREEIFLIDNKIDFDQLVMERWYHRELHAFENFNADKNHVDGFKIYLFADWLIRAKVKYEKHNAVNHEKQSQFAGTPDQLSEKQIFTFAQKLSKHPEFSSKYAEGNESYEQLAARIAIKLADPAQQQKWMSYLIQVGFKPRGTTA